MIRTLSIRNLSSHSSVGHKSKVQAYIRDPVDTMPCSRAPGLTDSPPGCLVTDELLRKKFSWFEHFTPSSLGPILAVAGPAGEK